MQHSPSQACVDIQDPPIPNLNKVAKQPLKARTDEVDERLFIKQTLSKVVLLRRARVGILSRHAR